MNENPDEYESRYNALTEQLKSAISRVDDNEVTRIYKEVANLSAARAAKSGDKLLIHLLAAIEESHKEHGHFHNTTAGLLLSMVVFRRIGFLEAFCDVLQPLVSQLMHAATQKLVYTSQKEDA